MDPTKFCDAMNTWRSAIKAEHGDDVEWRSRIDALDTVWTLIKKSALLGRLIYAEEPIRTRKCPQHAGRWSGIEGGRLPSGEWVGPRCEHGCGMTGWLPEPAAPSEPEAKR